MLLADSGFYFHLSRLVDSPEEYQYMQVLFVLGRDLGLSGGGDHNVHLEALPKLLGLPNSVSYIDINKFGTALYIPYLNRQPLRPFFEDFLWDPARSGVFHHDPAMWHAFAATHFLRFFSTASSQ